ncbi:hypothetical protein ABTX81_34470 [Kitasatospora sp. NPDC097605]|uniref:hypothetical protein n=1 Tax=Kitasatospora sp. NPDC097605 TaxID=3157226 RepID=UPI0033246D45
MSRVRPNRTGGRRPWAAAALLGLAALAAGCGIRPTAVPVDAGAPASRTACPTVARIPTAPGMPSPAAGTGAGAAPQSPAHAAAARAGSASAPAAASPSVSPVPPSASPSPVVVSPTPPADNVFGALPSPTASSTAPCR